MHHRKLSTPAYHLACALRQVSTAPVKLRTDGGKTDDYYELVRHRTSHRRVQEADRERNLSR
jgi:hypothetical protein